MIRLRVLLLLPVVLLACRPINGQTPVGTAVPIENASEVLPDSPRMDVDASPTKAGLPPTWTPSPADSGEILPSTSNPVTGVDATVVQGTAVPAYTGQSINYVVERGDTLAEICIAYSVPITEVARINNITDWDHIEVGQILIIPSEQ